VREFQEQQPLQDDCTLFQLQYLGGAQAR